MSDLVKLPESIIDDITYGEDPHELIDTIRDGDGYDNIGLVMVCLWIKTLTWKFNRRKTILKTTFELTSETAIRIIISKNINQHYTVRLTFTNAEDVTFNGEDLGHAMYSTVLRIVTVMKMYFNSEKMHGTMLDAVQHHENEWITRMIGANSKIHDLLKCPTDQQTRLQEMKWKL